MATHLFIERNDDGSWAACMRCRDGVVDVLSDHPTRAGALAAVRAAERDLDEMYAEMAAERRAGCCGPVDA